MDLCGEGVFSFFIKLCFLKNRLHGRKQQIFCGEAKALVSITDELLWALVLHLLFQSNVAKEKKLT